MSYSQCLPIYILTSLIQKRDDKSSSRLLLIALDAAKDQLHVRDAMTRVPDLHACAIPEFVVNALVTCIGTVNRSNRRCLLPKLRDSDYCSAHQSAIGFYSEQGKEEPVDMETKVTNIEESSGNDTVIGPFISIDLLLKNVRHTLRETLPLQENSRKWRIKCIEDAFLCERNEPFPLGLIVRRFFPGHGTSFVDALWFLHFLQKGFLSFVNPTGYHDGFISTVKRKELKEGQESRPVLLYRVKYIDGDEEGKNCKHTPLKY